MSQPGQESHHGSRQCHGPAMLMLRQTQTNLSWLCCCHCSRPTRKAFTLKLKIRAKFCDSYLGFPEAPEFRRSKVLGFSWLQIRSELRSHLCAVFVRWKGAQGCGRVLPRLLRAREEAVSRKKSQEALIKLRPKTAPGPEIQKLPRQTVPGTAEPSQRGLGHGNQRGGGCSETALSSGRGPW